MALSPEVMKEIRQRNLERDIQKLRNNAVKMWFEGGYDCRSCWKSIVIPQLCVDDPFDSARGKHLECAIRDLEAKAAARDAG
jgi:hypothetical protein